jgi:hypothetical protein
MSCPVLLSMTGKYGNGIVHQSQPQQSSMPDERTVKPL